MYYIFSYFEIIIISIYSINFAIYQTPLHIACKNNNVQIVKLLLSTRSIDINNFMEIFLVFSIFFNRYALLLHLFNMLNHIFKELLYIFIIFVQKLMMFYWLFMMF